MGLIWPEMGAELSGTVQEGTLMYRNGLTLLYVAVLCGAWEYTMTELLSVSKADLETVLEALLYMDGYEGDVYLDTEQIDAMRRLGQAMGLDPITVTPESERAGYPHEAGSLRQVTKQSRKDMGPGSWLVTTEQVNVCSMCGLSDGDPIHKVTK